MLLTTFATLAAALSATTPPITDIPFAQVSTSSSGASLRHALAEDGIITMSAVPGFSSARTRALASLGECVKSADAVTTVTMEDGSTLRQTIASYMDNGKGKPLQNLPATDACITFSRDAEFFRAVVDLASERFISAVDSACSTSTPWLKPSFKSGFDATEFDSLGALAQRGKHLEHFHLYTAGAGSNTNPIHQHDHDHNALEMHTDAGLFISMTPAMLYGDDSSKSIDTSTGLFVQLGDGSVVHPSSSDATTSSSIIFMLGDGANRWLAPRAKNAGSPCQFRPTPHGVGMAKAGSDAKNLTREKNDGLQRAWYGRMFMLPEEAIVAGASDHAGTVITYGQFMGMQQAAVGAGKREGDDLDATSIVTTATSRTLTTTATTSDTKYTTASRALFSVAGGVETCNEKPNGILCWMKKSCLSAADLTCSANQQVMCVDSDGNGQESSAMCPTCKPGCVTPPEPAPAFCNPSPVVTIMYMSGFVNVHDMQQEGCLLYLFDGWVLDAQWKFILACIGTFIAAAMCEALVKMRRLLQEKKLFKWQNSAKLASKQQQQQQQQGSQGVYSYSVPPPVQHKYFNTANYTHTIGLVLYGIQQVAGYFLMLVVMMYQTELFAMVILGLITGHAIFNLGGVVGESADMCCQRGEAETVFNINIGAVGGMSHPRETAKVPVRCVSAPKEDPSTTSKPTISPNKLSNPLITLAGSEKPPRHILMIEGMMCQNNCGSTVQRALMQVPGVTKAVVNFASNRAFVWCNDATRAVALVGAVEVVGFDATAVPTSP